jgi:thiol:disulfide interchange protein
MVARLTGIVTAWVLTVCLVGCGNSDSPKPNLKPDTNGPETRTTLKPVVGDTATTAGGQAVQDVDAGTPADETQAADETEPADADSKWADHTQKLPFIIGYEIGLAEAKAKDKPLMLFVTTTWCGWCKKHAEENFNDDSVKALLDKFVLVIVDGDTEPDALTKLGATEGFPHLIFQSTSGEKLGEQVGYSPVDEFKKVVEDALAKAGKA